MAVTDGPPLLPINVSLNVLLAQSSSEVNSVRGGTMSEGHDKGRAHKQFTIKCIGHAKPDLALTNEINFACYTADPRT